jgi:hypothetical protein
LEAAVEPSSAATTRFSRRQALEEFYKKHNPEQVGKVEELLTNFTIRDIAISLHDKYNEVPLGWERDVRRSWFW